MHAVSCAKSPCKSSSVLTTLPSSPDHSIQCSSEQWPCASCRTYHNSRRPKSLLTRWIQCVPFSMQDLDIYAQGMSHPNALAGESKD